MSSRLDDVEAKLAETEREADKARKDSKNARDEFADVKRRRYGIPSFYEVFGTLLNYVQDATCSIKLTTTFPIELIRSTRTLLRGKHHRWEASLILVWRTAKCVYRSGTCVSLWLIAF